MFIAANADFTNTQSFPNKFRPFPTLCYICKTSVIHRVDRVLGFFSSHPICDHPHPLIRRRVCPPFGFLGGGVDTRLRERGGGFQFGREDKYCGTPGIYVLCGMIYKCVNNYRLANYNALFALF